jgi:A/G-specific adenine glycosylase
LECPLQKKCIAFLNNKVSTLPVNNTVNKQKERFFNYLVIKHKGKFYVNKRTEKDIWQNLYEFVLIETKTWLDEKELFKNKSFLTLLNQDDFTVKFISKKISQKLTHQLITGRFIHVEIKKPLSVKTHFAVNNSQLKALPFPKFIASYLTDKNVSLNLINVF